MFVYIYMLLTVYQLHHRIITTSSIENVSPFSFLFPFFNLSLSPPNGMETLDHVIQLQLLLPFGQQTNNLRRLEPQQKKKKVTGNYAKNAQLSIIFLCPQTHAKTQT